jgi:hypothetical protein
VMIVEVLARQNTSKPLRAMVRLLVIILSSGGSTFIHEVWNPGDMLCNVLAREKRFILVSVERYFGHIARHSACCLNSRKPFHILVSPREMRSADRDTARAIEYLGPLYLINK